LEERLSEEELLGGSICGKGVVGMIKAKSARAGAAAVSCVNGSHL